ncbi:hypothetical protein NVB75_02895 [Pseudomonas sp. CBS]|uniref:hypothetical protein n=1 Tax=Pseudomonas sp. CBS TaxID=2971912 RepID=UPI0021ABB1D7|nr:hypothetical protein [Pseudomonas sp. CBS]WEL64606.1 hypothetical protein P0D93_31755 [Pseudomonas sp. CBSPGW29]WEL68073.1 hypothetical protein P0D94_17680 [Pseudomonas sp. CBSPCGW29]WEL75095.1 hypothetical protein P0D92_23705 [Pseudomonas sp. CBSPAW29]WEL89176.1 hypothetical protein P0D90_04375 [Pseudomonas sp. CBSPCBW29]UVH51829.1 hypothetical protein NVB75_02895 [Pseudomonas sp. CBS]
MTTSHSAELIAYPRLQVTAEDVRRFTANVYISDPFTFAAELKAFVRQHVETVERPVRLEMEAMGRILERKAAALHAGATTKLSPALRTALLKNVSPTDLRI